MAEHSSEGESTASPPPPLAPTPASNPVLSDSELLRVATAELAAARRALEKATDRLEEGKYARVETWWQRLKPDIRKILGAFAAFSSLGSGLLWLVSAKGQVLATLKGISPKAVDALTTLSIEHNYFAAYLAAAAGIAIGIALMLED